MMRMKSLGKVIKRQLPSHYLQLSVIIYYDFIAEPNFQHSSYLSRGPGLILWTAIHCNCFVHILVHLKEMKTEMHVVEI